MAFVLSGKSTRLGKSSALGGAVFAGSSHLKTDKKVQSSGEDSKAEEHQCGFCKKMLRSKRAMKRHQLTHTGEKRYSCSECGNKFVRKENMKRPQANAHRRAAIRVRRVRPEVHSQRRRWRTTGAATPERGPTLARCVRPRSATRFAMTDAHGGPQAQGSLRVPHVRHEVRLGQKVRKSRAQPLGEEAVRVSPVLNRLHSKVPTTRPSRQALWREAIYSLHIS
ncbi:hypothetical protein HPB51_009833 [Rhipicephalus microplus]|uniref:C2H2-type domain-containing protein n=1 Tax=Rhipicephalus microplus TaxID=6941 RepID=A0A9J6ENV4_RHIMP|nr:hypothetical protein HPB51_009833 [Rhipicephalus microplus]